MNNWKETTLREITDKVIDNRGKTPPIIDSGYEILEVNAISQDKREPDYSKVTKFVDEGIYKSWFRNGHIKEADILIPTVGTIGNVSFSMQNRGSIAQNLIALRINDKNYPLFVYYKMKSPSFKKQILNLDIGGVQPSVKVPHLLAQEILLPELEEQKQIASVLSSLDDKIELLRAENETLEKIAQGIFREWFVDFTIDGKKLKLENGVPEGWRVGKLGDEFEIIMGQSPSGESYNEKGDGMIFFQGRAEFQERFPKVRLYTTEPKRMAEKFDVLVSVRAPVGDINVAFDKCCIGRGVGAVRSDQRSYALYKTKSLKEAFDKFEAEGTVFGSINKDGFLNIKVIIPPIEIVKNFEEAASPIDQKIFNNYSQIQNLSRLRDTLLPKLMSGEIKV
jgi:type I restriction enzyme S subunit